MADLTTPTIKPPSQTDLLEQDQSLATTQNLASTAAPGSQPSVASSVAESVAVPPGQMPTYQPTDVGAGLDDLTANMAAFGNDALTNPSRWNAGLVQQGVDLINAEVDRATERTMANLDEYHSSRGTTGGLIEQLSNEDALVQLNQQRLDRMFNLNRELANTYGQDRAVAAQIGQQMAEAIRAQNLDAEDQARFAAQFGLSGQGLGLEQRALDLQALGMSQDEAFRYANLEQQQAQFEAQIGQEAQRLMQSDRSLDIEEARYQAQLGIEGRRIAENARQFDLQLSEQEAARLAEFDMFTRGLSSEEALARLDAETRENIANGNTSASLEVARINQQTQAASDAIRQAIALADNETQEQIAAAENALQETLAGLNNTSREAISRWANESAERISRGELEAREALQELVGQQNERLANIDARSRELIAQWANGTQTAIAAMDNATRGELGDQQLAAALFDALARAGAAIGERPPDIPAWLSAYLPGA